MVAVDATANHPQGQIDLGACIIDKLVCGGFDGRIGRSTRGHSKYKSSKAEGGRSENRCLEISEVTDVDAAPGASPAPAPTPLAALVVLFLLVRRGGGRRIVGQAMLDLGLDLRQVFRLGLPVAGVRPLELGLQRTADAPIGVTEVI